MDHARKARSCRRPWAGLRSIAYRERVIFFRVDEADLTVLRVLHGHQDISVKDFKQEEN
ncbi:type II toxin-antitoxin system RelE/ParE family toxin [Agrobacterium tumefaciens]|uniref:type II toxin-antitoxin system RelE/ParE family toxin n=1 Tax=Agrobacterium tumefaciens TaxID=358 RepID=UPI0012B7CC57|nr:type II toxin-antitoxin system RelE/ParE family toxin [Agrobacterium tumefaciens]MQB02892.1 type II toxin-antitoxin system RelE/ParE family toxin [Agrobacterium tumefaciens]